MSLGPDLDATQATELGKPPNRWFAQQPHGASLAALHDWWAQFNDPLLLEIMDAAQAQSNTLADAAQRIAEARALLVTRQASLVPDISAQGSVSRGTTILNTIDLGTTAQAQLQASWELDLFGNTRRNAQAAQARLTAEIAQWHAARISVAADTANLYTNYRACEQILSLTERDAQSRHATATLTGQLATTGFQSPANAALSRASAADGAGRAIAQKAECDVMVKALVAMTGFAESDLRQRLAARREQLPEPANFEVKQIPAQVLMQRPDVAAAEQQLLAANADIGARIAERLPRLMLTGNIGPFNFSATDVSINGATWGFGPSIAIPIFDAGRRAANQQTAEIAYQTAEIKYRAKVRSAVREVEEAMVNLESLQARDENARVAAQGYQQSLQATEAKYKFGLASLLELEETRRLSFNADNAWAAVRRDHVNAWIALYRAIGGGWHAENLEMPASALPHASSEPRGINHE